MSMWLKFTWFDFFIVARCGYQRMSYIEEKVIITKIGSLLLFNF